MTYQSYQECRDKTLEEAKAWQTLREQIIELWRSRGLRVLDIKVEPKQPGSWKWTVLAKEE